MSWLEETHGRMFELVRHFLARLFDSEMFSGRGQWRSAAVSAFALALPAAMVMLDPEHMLVAPRKSPLPDELALMTMLTAATGLVALIEWQSLFPSRRDYLALAGLPVAAWKIFAARFLVVLVFSCGLVGALNLLPALMAARKAAQALSAGLACFFVLFAIVALQGVLLNVLPLRWFARVSSYVQGALTAVVLLAGLLSWGMKEWQPEAIQRLVWFPPAWFVGLHRRMLGDGDPFAAAMAGRALTAFAIAAALMALGYLVSYRRYRKLLLEAPAEAISPRVRSWSAWSLLARAPRRLAIMQFMAKTLARSRVHRLVLLAYGGATLGILLNSSLIAGAVMKAHGWREAAEFAALLWPLAASFIMLSGLRHVLSMPAELRANWIFQSVETLGRAEWMSAVERFVIAGVIVPIHLALFLVGVAALGWVVALRVAIMQVLMSLTFFEILFYSWQQLPFTCSYVPGKRPLTLAACQYLVVVGFLVPLISRIIGAMSRFNGTFLVYGAALAMLWIWTRRRRRDGWGEGKMIYEDLPEALPNLGLRG